MTATTKSLSRSIFPPVWIDGVKNPSDGSSIGPGPKLDLRTGYWFFLVAAAVTAGGRGESVAAVAGAIAEGADGSRCSRGSEAQFGAAFRVRRAYAPSGTATRETFRSGPWGV